MSKRIETYIVGGCEVDVEIRNINGQRHVATVKLQFDVEVAGEQLEEFMNEFGTLIDTYQI